jgi:hypothetical protein
MPGPRSAFGGALNPNPQWPFWVQSAIGQAAAGAQSANLTAADSLTFAETAAKSAQAFTRTVTESLTFADTAPRAAQAPARTVTESLSFSESADRATVSRTRPISESLTFSETPARAAQAFSRTDPGEPELLGVGRRREDLRSVGHGEPHVLRSRDSSRPGVHADRDGRAHLLGGRDPPGLLRRSAGRLRSR